MAILTNAGGLGILCADACTAAGLDVPEPAADTRLALAAFLPAEAGLGNPIDMIASASGADFEHALRILAGAEEVDAVIVIFIPPLVTRAEEVATGIRNAVSALAGRKPILAVFSSAAGAPSSLSEGEARVPTYMFPEEAARALGRVVDWQRRRSRPLEESFRCDARRDEAHAVVAEALGEVPAGGWLSPERVARLLDCYGIQQAAWELAPDPRGVAAAVRRLKGPVAVKAVAPGLLHKSESGAVALGFETPRAAAAAARAMAARLAGLGSPPSGFVVQRMVPDGVEMIIGVVQDRVFGPVVAVGAGGTATELLNDVAFRIAPLAPGDADRMLRQLKTYPLLEGYRGSPAADLAAVRELLLRVGALADEQQAVAELDLNPVIAGVEGAIVVDARIRVEPVRLHSPEGSRPRPA